MQTPILESKMLNQTPTRYQDLTQSRVPASFRGQNKARVQLWFLTRDLLFRHTPHFLNVARIFLLRAFGARIPYSAKVRPSVDVFYPWNLEIGEHTYIGDRVNLYTLDRITIGNHVSISMGVTLCTGTHDSSDSGFLLIVRPIVVEDEVWAGAESFIAPGCHLARGTVLGARSLLTRSVENEGEIWVGSPAAFLRKRASGVPAAER